MSNNREEKIYTPSVHVLLALQRTTQGAETKKCVRQVVKDWDLDLAFLRAKVKVLGGEWRIHCTVNERDVEKARIWLIKRLLDFPEKGSFVDSEWRTALLQRECVFGDEKFMLDVDTKDEIKLKEFNDLIDQFQVIAICETPKGFHYITRPFDTREVCALGYVTLLRDGFYYVETVKGDKQ